MSNSGLLQYQIAEKLEKGEMNKSDMVFILMVLSNLKNTEDKKLFLGDLVNKYPFLEAYL